MTDSGTTTSTPTRRIVVGVVLVLAVVAGAVWFFFLRDTAPEEFTIEDAVVGLDDATENSDGGDTGVADDTPPELDGSWTVASDAGPDGAPSEAGYRVDEKLVDFGDKTVVGRTSDVVGAVTIEGTSVTEVTMTVDMGSVATDSSQRDSRYRSALEVDRFPTSTFVLSEPIELGTLPEPGEQVSVTATGDLTVHGVTRRVHAGLHATVSGSTLVVVGSIPVTFSDYGIEKPSAATVLSLDDDGLVEFQLYLTKD